MARSCFRLSTPLMVARDQMEKAILIIGGTQNELLVNVHEY